MGLRLDHHPCFDDNARHTFGRIHLPVAPKCNIQCNYCDRKYDCAAESRPGVTSAVLSPGQAVAYLSSVMALRPEIRVVGIAGPGDPFATPELTLETLRLVRAQFPEMLLCVATNGLALQPHIAELAALAVSHVTLTINAVDASIGAQIYSWMRDGTSISRDEAGAQLLLDRQLAAIRTLKAHGIIVKVNTIIVPGINDHHVAEVARTVTGLGADLLNCVPLYPVVGTVFGELPTPSTATMQTIRHEAEQYLPQMRHCTRCRADAVGLLGEAERAETFEQLNAFAHMPLNPQEDRPYVAVATQEGVLINLHLGDARTLHIYAQSDDGISLVETREAPPRGGGDERWLTLAHTLRDCRALLANRAGGAPCRILPQLGIRVMETEGLILDAVEAIYTGRRLPQSVIRRKSCAAGGCSGGGTGCG